MADDIHLDLPLKIQNIDQFSTPREIPELYPGTRPEWSYCFMGDRISPVIIEGKELLVLKREGERVLLDDFLKNKTGTGIKDRYAVLAVGSNGCPARLADQDKYGAEKNTAIPVLRGWVKNMISVYLPRIAGYGSIPSTVMGADNTECMLWVTLLTRRQLERMDRSENRGSFYSLIEIKCSVFEMEGAKRLYPLYAYHESKALIDKKNLQPIALSCFPARGIKMNRKNQRQVLKYVESLLSDQGDIIAKDRMLRKNYAIDSPMPELSQVIDPDTLPQRKILIENIG